MAKRFNDLLKFLDESGYNSSITALNADASFRRYYRDNEKNILIMDAPPEKGESVDRFHNIQKILAAYNLSVPKIYSLDRSKGFMVLEDFGNDLYAKILNKSNENYYYKKTLDLLIELRKRSIKDPEKLLTLDKYSFDKLNEEAKIFFEWYIEQFKGKKISDHEKNSFTQILYDIYNKISPLEDTLVLRDYHVENIFYLSQREGVKKVGLIDFQDALLGSNIYDLSSLLEDVRNPLDLKLKENLIQYYVERTELSIEEVILQIKFFSIQRSLKIIGIFFRLHLRDNKDKYLKYLPNAFQIIKINIQDPIFTDLKNWIKDLQLEDLKI